MVLLAGCGNGPDLQTAGSSSTTVFVVSEAWQQSVPAEEFEQRRDELTQAVERLRSETASGWVARQDDETGYVGQLRGGDFGVAGSDDPRAVAEAFLDAYGPDLFGVTAAHIELPEESAADASGNTSLRGQQHVDGVPVVDGVLTLATSVTGEEARLTLVSGRVFPGVDVDTEPTVSRRKAAMAAEESTAQTSAEGSAEPTAQGQAELVVLPVGDRAGALSWRVIVVGGSVEGVEEVFVDANTGRVLRTRPGQISALPRFRGTGGSGDRSAVAQAGGGGGEPVPLTGQGPRGEELAATGTRRPDGTIVVRDTTTPWYDPATDRGVIEVYDGTGLSQGQIDQLNGRLATSDGPRVQDGDVIAAQSYARYLSDYWHQVFGRRGWDGEGGNLGAVVHIGGEDFCNASFSAELTPAQMVYGGACILDGARQNATFIEIDVTGHEVTHGVIDSTAGLLYTGQSGAMNESMADYFGNVIGDAYTGRESAALGEDTCAGITEMTEACSENPDGTLSTRYLLNGATMNDYLALVDPPFRYRLIGLNQDNGGVHLNSAIWNNALWSIRTRLARVDNVPANDSPRARVFDQIVYAALDRYMTATSGFLDGRVAIEQAAADLAAEPIIQDTIREVFDLNAICAGCTQVAGSNAVAVTSTSATQKTPSLGLNRVAWVDGGEFLYGQVADTEVGGQPMTRGEPDRTVSVGMAGDSVVSAEEGPGGEEQIVLRAPGADSAEVLDTLGAQVDFIAGVAGSPEGAAWINLRTEQVMFVDPAGTVTSTDMPAEWLRQVVDTLEQGAPPLFSVATGGGTVAVSGFGGELLVWKVGQEPTVLDQLGVPVTSVAVHGNRLLVMTLGESAGSFAATGPVLLIDVDSGSVQTLSQDGVGLGAAISAEYAVWPQSVGALQGAVAEGLSRRGAEAADSDLYLYSFATGQTYSLQQQRGQQAFPTLSGNRLAWQDGVYGGDDILTAVIPPSL